MAPWLWAPGKRRLHRDRAWPPDRKRSVQPPEPQRGHRPETDRAACRRAVEQIAGGFVLLSGIYLAYYFWMVDINNQSDPITVAVENFQRRVITGLNNNWQLVAIILGGIVVVSGMYVRSGREARQKVDVEPGS